MDQRDYVAWLSEIDELSTEQRVEAGCVLAEQPSREALICQLEDRIGVHRRCPHCAVEGAVIRGRSNGLQRYFCRGCSKTFNCLTGTPLARLRHKERWFDFGASMSKGQTVAASAARCGVAGSTAFRWRHRFLRAASSGVVKLCGIVEADETFLLASRKGERALDRKPRKRGGKASKPGLSNEMVPVLVAADRSGSTVSGVLSSVCAAAIEAVLRPVLSKDAMLVTDGCTSYPPCAAALGVSHEVLNQSAGERVRGDLHIQTVKSRHERLKSFLRSHRGVATKYLGSYLRWYHLVILPRLPSLRAGLATAAGMLSFRPTCIANAN
ncbi:IS1595 family transposase [Acidiphilium sp.]|uniref:IS1595 family transposase n=1 Tax=Acidiphilium sp. TaxID=527 RepID=UPI003D050C02